MCKKYPDYMKTIIVNNLTYQQLYVRGIESKEVYLGKGKHNSIQKQEKNYVDVEVASKILYRL